MKGLSFLEVERQCEAAFGFLGGCFHLFTSGKDTPNLLKCEDDFKFCINLLARCLAEFPGIAVLQRFFENGQRLQLIEQRTVQLTADSEMSDKHHCSVGGGVPCLVLKPFIDAPAGEDGGVVGTRSWRR